MRTVVSKVPAARLAGLALLGTVLLGGCASASSNAEPGSPSPSSPSSPSASAKASTTPSNSTTTAPGASVEPGVPSSVPLCTADKLSGAIEDTAGGGAAGSAYSTLVLTNTSTATCSTLGFPGVSYLSASGSQVGAPAVRSEGTPETLVILEPGQSAAAVLRETRPENYGDACGRVATSGFLVYPPEDTASLTVAHAGSGCSNEDIDLLGIDRLQLR